MKAVAIMQARSMPLVGEYGSKDVGVDLGTDGRPHLTRRAKEAEHLTSDPKVGHWCVHQAANLRLSLVPLRRMEGKDASRG